MSVSHKSSISFAVMTALVFIGINLPFLMGGVSTGPNVDFFLGLTGWLWIHRGSQGISVEQVDLALFLFEICLAVGLAWLLSKALHGSTETANVYQARVVNK